MIPYGRQSLGKEEIEAVTAVLKSNWLTQGPKIKEFEDQLASYVKVEHTIAVSNGTAALHLACLALDVSKGDIVWTAPITFVASANCALYCGASIDFVDIDPHTRNISLSALATKLEHAAIHNQLPKVIVVVHFCGAVCDMRAIKALVQPYQIKIIEDAAHALGSTYENHLVGSCAYSDITTFSFHPVKNIATGEGGAVCTNNSEWASNIRELVSHGITRNRDVLENTSHGAWYYEQRALGWNYRITDIQCALGIVQLSKLESFIAARREKVERYNHAFSDSELALPFEISASCAAWHIYVIGLPDLVDRNAMFEYLKANGIGTAVHYIPVHTQPYYRSLGFRVGDFPVSESFYQQALTLPLFPELTSAEQDKVVAFVKQGLNQLRVG